jgi:hypothetical protein
MWKELRRGLFLPKNGWLRLQINPQISHLTNLRVFCFFAFLHVPTKQNNFWNKLVFSIGKSSILLMRVWQKKYTSSCLHFVDLIMQMSNNNLQIIIIGNLVPNQEK